MVDKLKAKGPWWELSPYIRSREEFVTHGALKGVEQIRPLTSYGQLPAEYSESVRRADYVIYSYSTPIAWCTPGDGWTVPDVKYSRTTTAHQNKISVCIPDV